MPLGAPRNAGLFSSGAGLFFRENTQKQKEELERLLYHDTFTGLPNWEMLQSDYQQLPTHEGWVFTLIRINGFIRLNAIFGLDLGGKTIQRLCPVLTELSEGMGGRAYRLALDQFALLVPADDLQVYLEKLKKTLHDMEQIRVEDQHTAYSYHYTFAYGVYCLSAGRDDLQDIESSVDFCDSAIQRLKSDSATEGTVFDEKSKPDWELRHVLERSVFEAWQNREFLPYYQPVYDLRSNKPVGAELLTRWQHPQRGLVAPNDFLPILESKGMIMDLDLYMLEEACKKIQKWIDQELITVPLSVNISKLNIHRVDFLSRVVELVKSYDIPPVLIEMELNEAVVLQEKNPAFLNVMKEFHKCGFQLTMDNFAATDYSSINLLRDVPVDIIKLSRNFFEHIDTSDRDRIFVADVLRLINDLGIKSVINSVESAEQAAAAGKMGCHYAQGFYFSRPLCNDDFEKLIF